MALMKDSYEFHYDNYANCHNADLFFAWFVGNMIVMGLGLST